MAENWEDSLNAIKSKAEQVFDPGFFGAYSFEYAYRLLLVYLLSNKTMIRSIRASCPNAFDHAFEECIEKAISFVTDYRGLGPSEKLLSLLLTTANDSLVLFLKSQCPNTPTQLAKNVAKVMDKQYAEAIKTGGKFVITQKVFQETGV